MMRATLAQASGAKASRSAWKSGFETPSETYQTVSPVAGETKAVTQSHS